MTRARSIFQGEFGEILIPDLLTFLDMLGKTGTLELRRGGVTKRIHWQDGEIIFADSTAPEETIGRYLVINGWVAPDAVEKARARCKTDADLVKNLIRDGSLRPDLLPKSERSLVLDIVYSIFEWRDGTFNFVLTPEPHADRVVLKTSVSNIIMEGSRRLDEWKRIGDTFASDEVYPRAVADPPKATHKLPQLELDVLAQVDGRRNVSEIVRAVEHDRFTVLNALLTLHAAGLVSIANKPADAEAAGAALPEEERLQAIEILQAFNNIFASLLERVRRLKGDEASSRFESNLGGPSFQRNGPFAGVAFTPEGRIPPGPVLKNLAGMPAEDRLPKLKGSLDRLLAKQVLMLDTSVPAADKQAISDLIAREKERLVQSGAGLG